MLSLIPGRFGVVAHDAGAANQIIALLRKSGRTDFEAAVQGPALKSWPQVFPSITPRPIQEILETADTLLSGTSWASDLEHNARLLARNQNIRSITLLDHWVNYRERFIRNGVEVLPDEIWCTDEYAMEFARNTFPKTHITRVRNCLLEDTLDRIRGYERGWSMEDSTERVLYVLEPIRVDWRGDGRAGEFQALDYFVSRLRDISRKARCEIRLRLHPSETVGKYDEWLHVNRSLNPAIDHEPDLASSIAWATLVAGCQSYPMVVALEAGRYVVSTNPPWAPQSLLPQRGIIPLSTLAINKI